MPSMEFNRENFARSVDPSNVMDIRDPADIQGISETARNYLTGVQQEIFERIKQPGGKADAEAYLHRQMEKFINLNNEDASKVRTELYDYTTAVVWFAG